MLGSQSELSEGIRMGTIDMILNEWSNIATVNGFSQGLILGFPFLYQSWDHIRAFYDSEVMDQMKADLEAEQGIICLGCSADGFRKIYTQIPIESIDDFSKLKIRVPDNQIYTATMAALGAAPTIVATAELCTSLQNGIVNALERPADGMYSNNLYAANV